MNHISSVPAGEALVVTDDRTSCCSRYILPKCKDVVGMKDVVGKKDVVVIEDVVDLKDVIREFTSPGQTVIDLMQVRLAHLIPACC